MLSTPLLLRWEHIYSSTAPSDCESEHEDFYLSGYWCLTGMLVNLFLFTSVVVLIVDQGVREVIRRDEVFSPCKVSAMVWSGWTMKTVSCLSHYKIVVKFCLEVCWGYVVSVFFCFDVDNVSLTLIATNFNSVICGNTTICPKRDLFQLQ